MKSRRYLRTSTKANIWMLQSMRLYKTRNDYHHMFSVLLVVTISFSKELCLAESMELRSLAFDVFYLKSIGSKCEISIIKLL